MDNAIIISQDEDKIHQATLVIDGKPVLVLKEEIDDKIPKFTTPEMWDYFA